PPRLQPGGSSTPERSSVSCFPPLPERSDSMESDSGILEPPRLARGVGAVGQQAVPTILARVHDQAGAGESGGADSAGARPGTEVGALRPGTPAERSTVDAPPHCAVGLRREQATAQ